MKKSNHTITFINTHLLPDERYGGVVYSGDGLFRGLAGKFNARAVCASTEPYKVREHYLSENLEVHSFKSIFSHKLGISISMIFGLPRILRSSNFVVINGIFTFPVTYAALFCILFRIPFSVALRGGYEPWRLGQKRNKKKLFNFFVTNLILKKSAFIHVISEMEWNSVPLNYQEKSVIIPNGFDNGTYDLYKSLKERSPLFDSDGFTFLFLSRTDKEKGLDIVFDSFKEILSLNDGVKLKLVGPDNNGYLKNLLKAFPDVPYQWIPGLYGEDKIMEILKADVVILPSYSENFGNIILEALLFGTPVITSTGTPWVNIIPNVGCGWICEPEKKSFMNACEMALQVDQNGLKELGLRGQNYIKENYSWYNIAVLFSEKIKNHLDRKEK